MTWYEWGMCVDRINSINERRNQGEELQIGLQRHLMSLIANVNGNKTNPSEFLTIDKPEPERPKISPKELEAKFKNRKKR